MQTLPRAAKAGGELMTRVSLNCTEPEQCNCDESRMLRAHLAELHEAASLVLSWIDRSTSVGKDAAARLEQALSVPGCSPPPAPTSTRCDAPNGRHGITCELPAGHGGVHRCCQVRWC